MIFCRIVCVYQKNIVILQADCNLQLKVNRKTKTNYKFLQK